MKNKRSAEEMERLGFTKSASGRWHCDQCEALSINGVPCHEHGCPNRSWECPECGEMKSHTEDFCDCLGF
jgi:rubrerythrin